MFIIALLGFAAQETVLIYRGVPVAGEVVANYKEVIFTGDDFITIEGPVVRFQGLEQRMALHTDYYMGQDCVVLYDEMSGNAAHLGPHDSLLMRLWVCKYSSICGIFIAAVFLGGVAYQVLRWFLVMAPNLDQLSKWPKSLSQAGECAKSIEQLCVSLIICLLWLTLCGYGVLQVLNFKSTDVMTTGMVMLGILALSWISLPGVWNWLRTTAPNLPHLKPWLQFGEMTVALYVCYQVGRLFYGENGTSIMNITTLNAIIADLLQRVLGA